MLTQELSPIFSNNAFIIVYLHAHLHPCEPNCNILFACDFIAHPFISMLSLKSQPPEYTNQLYGQIQHYCCSYSLGMHSPRTSDVNSRYCCTNYPSASLNSLPKF